MGRTKKKDATPLAPVRRRLLRLLAAKGSTLRTASLAMGRNDAYLQLFIRKGTPKVLAEDDREILAEHLGCRPELLKHGRSFRLSTHAKRPPPCDAYSAPQGYSVVPEADVRLEPGAEAWNGELQETGEAWLFADSLIRHQLRADPGDLWMIAVDGDSMEPLLSSGDHILIDVSRTVPAPPGIFVIWDGMALVAKRIEHVPHSDPPRVVLKPVNPEYDSCERPAEEIRVVGRAVGSRNGRRGWRASRGRSARAGGRYIASSTPDAERVAMKILPVGHRQSDSSSERSMSWERRQ